MDAVALNLNLTPDQTAASVNQILVGEGYVLERYEYGNPIYTIGDQTARLFLGAFVKRHQFAIKLDPLTSGCRLTLIKASAGLLTGGLWGYISTNREFKRLGNLLELSLQSPLIAVTS